MHYNMYNSHHKYRDNYPLSKHIRHLIRKPVSAKILKRDYPASGRPFIRPRCQQAGLRHRKTGIFEMPPIRNLERRNAPVTEKQFGRD